MKGTVILDLVVKGETYEKGMIVKLKISVLSHRLDSGN